MDDGLVSGVRAKPARLVVGLNSGTSMDAVDALLVRLHGFGDAVRIEPLAFRKHALDAALRTRLLRAPDLTCRDVCELNREVGFAFADAALAVAADARIDPAAIDLVASHGQTVCHLPAGSGTSTLQIGDLDVIAARTGTLVVGDFRAADVAHGGAGAPLMPYLDRVLFRERPGTIALNLGGITSLTYIGAASAPPVAFDVGPANVPLDLLAARVPGDGRTRDEGGAIARSGRVREDVMARLLAHPFVRRPAPKTSGREEFGGAYVARLVEEHASVPLQDLLATHTAFVGRSVADAVDRFVPGGRGAVTEVVASGGGIHNAWLMECLARAIAPVPLRTQTEAGCGPDAKEALLFAVLGNDRLFGVPTNIPSVTGATRAVSLGKLAGRSR